MLQEQLPSDYYFSQLIRTIADEIRESYSDHQATVLINRFKLKSLLEYIAVKQNTSFLELGESIDVSKRTLSKMSAKSAKESDVMIQMHTATVEKILEYAYSIAEIYDKS